MSKLQYEANLIMRDARQVTNYKGKFEMWEVYEQIGSARFTKYAFF